MTVVVISADNTRVEDGEAVTGWASIGSGPGGSSEGSFFYENAKLFNRKVTSGTGAGFFYTPTNDSGSAQDMTAAAKAHMMVKLIVTDFGGLQPTDGIVLRIGSDGSNYYGFILAGTDSPLAALAKYKPVGGFLIVPVNPNENSTYNDVNEDAGSPNLALVDYFALIAKFATASAKSENVGLDAIDLGTGLYLVSGEGADPDGTYQMYATFDEDTITNRFGYARFAEGGGLLFFGTMRVGENAGGAVETVFTDSASVITFPDAMYGAGFCGVRHNLGNANTIINDGCLLVSDGGTVGVDRRADYIVVNTNGVHTFFGQLRNFRNVALTSACTVNGGADISCADLDQSNSDISDCKIRTTALTSIATLTNPDFTKLANIDFIQEGAGHALEIDTASTYTFDNLRLAGYGADAGDDAALDITASTGTVTINVINGGDTPTFKTAGATVVINNTKTVQITTRDAKTGDLVATAFVAVEAAAGGDLPANVTVTISRTGSVASVAHTAHGMVNGQNVVIRKADQQEYNGVFTITNVTANAYDYTVSGTPATPATGTIKCSASILYGTTNGSGVIEDTGFAFTGDQPVTGRAKRATTSPLYQFALIQGTITTAGFTTNTFMVPDE